MEARLDKVIFEEVIEDPSQIINEEERNAIGEYLSSTNIIVKILLSGDWKIRMTVSDVIHVSNVDARMEDMKKIVKHYDEIFLAKKYKKYGEIGAKQGE